MTTLNERQTTLLLQRMERILTKRVEQFDITIYKGGFVNLQILMTKAPIFQRFKDLTLEQLKTLLTADARFTLGGPSNNFGKANTGHAFDINAVSLADLPV